jgi:nucleotide-binding universal stress UspA family protein
MEKRIMERHYLLTISEDVNALYGVRFAASFFKNKKKACFTVCYVATKSVIPGRTAAAPKQSASSAEALDSKGEAALSAGRKILLDSGFNNDQITTKLISKRQSTVKDIVQEARAGLYDAVILGRRGYALFEQTFSTSVSREILDQEIDFPVWICKRPETGRENVLLCVDETEPSMRIADHVGFVLQEEEHKVTLLYVETGDGAKADSVIGEARERLMANQVAEDRIRTLVVRSSNVSKALLDEAEKGRFAAVAVGRGGARPKGMFKKWITGSKSTKLLEELDKAVLWVSK